MFIDLARTNPQRRGRYVGRLTQPAVVPTAAFIAAPLQVKFSRNQRPPHTLNRLSPPTVVFPDSVPGDGKRTLRTYFVAKFPPRVRRAISFLGAPVVVTAATAPPVETTVRTHFAASRSLKRTRYQLSPPQVVTPVPPVETTIHRKLANFRPRPVQSKLSPPQVVNPAPPVETTIRRKLTNFRFRPVQSKLQPPTVVGPAAQPPVVTTIKQWFAARTPKRRTISVLGGPVIVGAAVTPPSTVDNVLRVHLAKQPPLGYGRYRKSGYSLAGPMEVNFPPAVTTIQSTFAPPLPQRRAVQYHLGKPVLAAPSPPVVTTATVTLAPQRRQVQKVQYRLRPPTAVVVLVPTPTINSTATVTCIVSGATASALSPDSWLLYRGTPHPYR